MSTVFPHPIRLITCDIDGTLLLNGASCVDLEVLRQVDRLLEKGVLFCPASGRQYQSLRGLFPRQADKLHYICENGAIVYGPGSPGPVLGKNPMPRLAACRLAHEILALEGVEICLAGANTSYLCPKTEAYLALVRDGYGNNTAVLKTPEDCPEDIVKISAYCPQGVTPVQAVLFPRWKGTFQCAVSGAEWIDFTVSDKGTGLMLLCRALGIALENVLSFGDNYNDLPMLQLAGCGYLMEGAAQELRRRIPRQCSRVQDILRLV